MLTIKIIGAKLVYVDKTNINLNNNYMKNNKQKFVDVLNDLGNRKVTEEHYYNMLEVLPPEMMYDGAFLVGEPMNSKYCIYAKGVVEYFDCYAKASDGSYLGIGAVSKAMFKKCFIQNNPELTQEEKEISKKRREAERKIKWQLA